MGYDDWKTRVPDSEQEDEPSPHDDDCTVCQARYDEPCELWCDCHACLTDRAQRERRHEDAA